MITKTFKQVRSKEKNTRLCHVINMRGNRMNGRHGIAIKKEKKYDRSKEIRQKEIHTHTYRHIFNLILGWMDGWMDDNLMTSN